MVQAPSRIGEPRHSLLASMKYRGHNEGFLMNILVISSKSGFDVLIPPTPVVEAITDRKVTQQLSIDEIMITYALSARSNPASSKRYFDLPARHIEFAL